MQVCRSGACAESGKHAQALPPRPHPKLDVKLLRDFSPKGPVYETAVKCEQARKLLKGPVKRIDFVNPARRKEVCLQYVTNS